MDDFPQQIAYLLSRFGHIVAVALLLGGTLFYELIVPVAIDELKDPQKLIVFARARWAFRWIVWCSAVVLIASGMISSYRSWYGYTGVEQAVIGTQGAADVNIELNSTHLASAGYFWLAHVITGMLALIIAIVLVRGPTPPRYPLVWMRINIVVLLVTIFLAATARHVRLRMLEMHLPHDIPTAPNSDNDNDPTPNSTTAPAS